MNDDDAPSVRLVQLRIEHRLLDEEIDALVLAGTASQLDIARLKKRKLLLKDEIELLYDRNVPDIIA